jgi:hypothetical protein
MKEELKAAQSLAEKLAVVARHYDLTQPLGRVTSAVIDTQLQNIANTLKLPKK